MNVKNPLDWLKLLIFLALGVFLAGAFLPPLARNIEAVMALVALAAAIVAMYLLGRNLFLDRDDAA